MANDNGFRQWSRILILGFVVGAFGLAVAAAPASPQGAATVKYDTNALGMEFVVVPAGEFQMGCSEKTTKASDKDGAVDGGAGFSTNSTVTGANYRVCFDDEEPQHAVQITHSFEIAKTEVTQKQWQAVMGSNPSFHQDEADLPVEEVGFQDVQQFLGKLNARNDGFVYRLPTEAEWEYAARAGTTDPYAGPIAEAWYDDGRLGGGEKAFIGFDGETLASTHKVAAKKPNAWGIFDMRGNVAEWVQDWYDPVYYSHSSTVDPKGPVSGEEHVARGGSWHTYGPLTRVSARAHFTQDYQFDDVGFRVVREKR